MGTVNWYKKLVLFLCVMPAFLIQGKMAYAIVNMDDLHFRQHEQGLSGAVNIKASQRSGNTDSSNVALGSQLQWNKESYINLLVFGYEYGKSNNQRNLNKSFVHLRHVRNFSDVLDYEFFGQLEENEFTRLTYRGLFGTGVRLPFAAGDRHIAYFGLGGFHEVEKIAPRAGSNEDGIHRAERWNVYLLSRYKSNSRVKFSNTLYYQPRMDDKADRRALFVSLLSVKATESISMQFSIELSNDSKPPIGVEKTDSTVRTGFKYAF